MSPTGGISFSVVEALFSDVTMRSGSAILVPALGWFTALFSDVTTRSGSDVLVPALGWFTAGPVGRSGWCNEEAISEQVAVGSVGVITMGSGNGGSPGIGTTDWMLLDEVD